MASKSFKSTSKEIVQESVRKFTREEEFKEGMLTIMSGSILPSEDWQLAMRLSVRAAVLNELQPGGVIRIACDAGGLPSDEVTQLAIDVVDASYSGCILAGLQSQVVEATKLANASPQTSAAYRGCHGIGLGNSQEIPVACV